MKLEKLTPEQTSRLMPIRDKALKFALGGDDSLDVDAFHKGIDFVYSLAKIDAPIKIWVDSPLGIQYAAQIIQKLPLKGDQVGDQVWTQVRAQVRAQVRDQVWTQVWAQVGDQVWTQVRDQVWTQVRDQVRDQVGAQVRDQVGAQVRAQVWDQVRDQVWTQVWAQVRAQVGDQVRDQVWAQVRDQVRDQVWTQVWAQVGDQVWTQVWAQVGDQVWTQVRAQVWAQVWDQVRDQVGAQYHQFAYCGVAYDSGWVNFYRVFTEFNILKHDLFNQYSSFLDSGVWDTVMFQGAAIGCRRPNFVARDEENRLHNDNRSAIAWRDGFELFYLDGVHLKESLWKQIISQKMTFDEIVAIEDADVRAVALKYNKNAIIASGAELIDEHPQFGELFLIKGKQINTLLEEQELYFMRMKCPTGRVFVECVEPGFAKQYPYALNCQAKAFGVPPEIYSQLQPRNES